MTPPPVLEVDEGFVVAAGIECSAPVIAGGIRQDELRKTGHWERYREDLELVASFGIRYLRYGVPFHVVANDPDPTRFDWDWTDRALGALRTAGIEPILDLLHFGLPDDICAVGDPALIPRYERFVEAVVERYPWVRYYTPVNEPYVTAWFSAREGLWNERRRDDVSFVAAIDNVAHCAVRGMHLISERRPDAIFIQSDACDTYAPADPSDRDNVELARLLTERSWVAYDLSYGREPTRRVVDWLRSNGISGERLDWFAANGSSQGCIIGHDYYKGNERVVDAAGRVTRAGDRRRGFQALALDFYDRYRLPFMLSETNIAGRLAPGWLAEVWNDAMALKERGLPIRGFCWYGFIDHVDWDSALTRDRGIVNPCGLVGLDRRPHPVGELYRRLAELSEQGVEPRLGRRGRSRAVTVIA
ncbi:family 1 glycosylhydrolase [Desertimonas flava]|uniref:family 1 glycosylhydrolase n=1 Tax=Desertimonas flava TaxID=2064846 RepID=UPI000E3526CE|nr:family 1 glycosylhydrolase [Desertimonas flava]